MVSRPGPDALDIQMLYRKHGFVIQPAPKDLVVVLVPKSIMGVLYPFCGVPPEFVLYHVPSEPGQADRCLHGLFCGQHHRFVAESSKGTFPEIPPEHLEIGLCRKSLRHFEYLWSCNAPIPISQGWQRKYFTSSSAKSYTQMMDGKDMCLELEAPGGNPKQTIHLD